MAPRTTHSQRIATLEADKHAYTKRLDELTERVRAPPFFGEPKTAKSRRSIPVHPTIMAKLREHKAHQLREIMLAGPDWNRENDLVFPGRNGEIWVEQSFRRYTFSKVAKAAGLKGFNPYSLRHTCATLLLLAGVNPKIVSERLGHSTVAMKARSKN